MKTTIAAIVLLSGLGVTSVFANEQPRDVLESSLEQSIQQDVLDTRSQVKSENQLELMQFVADFKFALNPSNMVATVAEVATEYFVSGKE